MIFTALAALRRVGLEVSRTRPNLIDFLQSRSVDCVLDVGANTGQFGRWLRNHGYTGRIISFEPISKVYQVLVQEARGDVLWETKNLAIGDHCGTATINVGSNSALSSFLSVSEVVPSDRALSFKERNETVAVTTLDELGAEVSGNVFLKSDTQGFERPVLEGAKKLLSCLRGVQLELPIVHVYRDTWTLPQAVEYMYKNGFVISQIHPASFLLTDKASLWEVDAIFRRLDPAIDLQLRSDAKASH
jgi:FkbM family methyltransferase